MRRDLFINSVLCAMLFVCTALFFSFLYPAHIRFQEQYQLFEFAGDYFLHTVSVPGGFSDWCGRFLTQFFAIPWLGALVTASLSTAAYVLYRRLPGGGSLLHLLLSLVPAILLSVMFLADEYLPGAAVALLFSLSAAVVIRSMDRSYIRTFLSLVIPAALYFLAGPAAVLTALLIPRDERLAVRIFAPLPVLLLPLLISASLFMLWKTTDFEKEETMRYDFMAENEDWDGIIRTARKSAPANALSTGCLNLALACSGQLPDFQKSARCYKRLAETGMIN